MSEAILRDWFVPGEGIDRHVISAGIQRYLGNDATVRPGRTPDDNGVTVEGFWVKAYRTLTEPMKDDLKRDTAKWRNERERTGKRGTDSLSIPAIAAVSASDLRVDYANSQTFQNATDARIPPRTGDDSPMRDAPFNPPPVRDNRTPVSERDRPQAERIPAEHYGGDRMPVDAGLHGQPDPRFAGRPFAADGRPFPNPINDRPYNGNGHQYQPDQPMHDAGYNRQAGPYSPEVGYGYAAGYQPPPHDGPGQGFPRPANYHGGVSAPFDPAYGLPTTRGEPMHFQGQQYGGLPNPLAQGRDVRDARDVRDPRDFNRDMTRDQPRYGGQNEYVEPRFQYPSPTPTTLSVNMPHEPITNPASYPAPPPPSYVEPFNNRPVQPNYGANQEAGYQPRDAQFGRERQPPNPDVRDARRRKIN